jgi:hypothetical protein
VREIGKQQNGVNQGITDSDERVNRTKRQAIYDLLNKTAHRTNTSAFSSTSHTFNIVSRTINSFYMLAKICKPSPLPFINLPSITRRSFSPGATIFLYYFYVISFALYANGAILLNKQQKTNN